MVSTVKVEKLNKMQQTGFIVKLLIASTAVSVLIKYGDAYFLNNPSLSVVLLCVLSPTVLLAIALGTRYATHINR